MIATELHTARSQTDSLLAIVRPDALYDRPIAERHRIIFYLGHLEAFDWNLIGTHVLGSPSMHPTLDRLFAFGIDPDASGLPQDQASDWPNEEEVRDFNARIRQAIDAALPRIPEQYLHVAVEHRLMHAETLAYMLHNLPFDRKVAGPQPHPGSGESPRGALVDIPAGRATLGALEQQVFGWDNEFSAHDVDVPAFAAGAYKVTNAEYLEFVKEGAAAPFFWRCDRGRWVYRGMFGEVPLPMDAPVYVTQRQASEFVRWRGKRLLTEAEFQRAGYSSPAHPESDNFDFHAWDPIPVSASRANSLGLHQMVGNGWEWTSTLFEPFPGFQAFPFYPNYSEPFFDGQHYVLKGASARTAAKLTRPSFRNWFRPSYPYVYGTFRLAEN